MGFLCLRCLKLFAEYIFPPPEVSVQSQLKILTLGTMLGSGRLHESRPCCLFICSRLFLVTEARNGCVVGLGVSTNAQGYFDSTVAASSSPQTPPEPDLGHKKKKKKVYMSERTMR